MYYTPSLAFLLFPLTPPADSIWNRELIGTVLVPPSCLGDLYFLYSRKNSLLWEHEFFQIY
jgi:hypothetical protein